MKSVEEIKRNPKGSFTEVYGISKDEFQAVSFEIAHIVEEIFGKGDLNATECAIRVLEEVLFLKDYSAEQLLRMALLLRNLSRFSEFKERAMIALALKNPQLVERYLNAPASYEVICPHIEKRVPKVLCMRCPYRQNCLTHGDL